MGNANEDARKNHARAESRIASRVAQESSVQILTYVNHPGELDMADLVYFGEQANQADNVEYVNVEHLQGINGSTEYGAVVAYNGPSVDEATLGAAVVAESNS